MNDSRLWPVSMIIALIIVTVATGTVFAAPLNSPTLDGPAVGPVRFTVDVEYETNRPLSTGNKFREGTYHLCAVASYQGLQRGTTYSFRWYDEGLLIRQGEDAVPSDSGQIFQCLTGPGRVGIGPGVYTFEIALGGETILSQPAIVNDDDTDVFATDFRCGPLYFRRGYDESSTRFTLSGTRFAPGTKEILVGFGCSNAPTGTPYRTNVFWNGQPLSEKKGTLEDPTGLSDSLKSPDGGPLSAGTYRVVFEVHGHPTLAGEAVVEGFGGFGAQPYFGPLAFSTRFDEAQQTPLDAAITFDRGIDTIYTFWPYADVLAGTAVRVTWFRNGASFSTHEGTFDQPQGSYWVKASRDDGALLDPGTYRAVVEVNGQVILAEECVVGAAGARETPRYGQFGPITFSSAIDDATGQPLDSGIRFPYGITHLYAHWPYRDATAGTTYYYKWFYNEESLTGGEGELDTPADTMWDRIYYTDGMPLDPGPYGFSISVGGTEVIYGACVIEEPEGPA